MLRGALLLAGVACAAALGGCFSDGRADRDAGNRLDDGAGRAGGQEPWLIDDQTLPGGVDDSEPGASEPPAPIQIADGLSVPALAPVAITELAGILPETAELVGVALGPDGVPYVLDAHAGLYALTGDGARLVFDLPASRVSGGTSDGSPPAEVTDIAFDPNHGLDDGNLSFALTAENDGFLLSLPSGSIASHFCYFPPVTDWEVTSNPSVSQELRAQGIPVVERTEAVAVSPLNGQIVAQPRTLRVDRATVVGSELFVFGTAGGQPVGTRRFERIDFVAGGAAFLSQMALVLGSGDALYVSLGWADQVRRIATLAGVTQITGIASHPGGNLLVLDGPSKRLLELDGLQLDAAISGP